MDTRLSDQESAIVLSQAGRLGLSLSDFARRAALHYAQMVREGGLMAGPDIVRNAEQNGDRAA